VNLPTTAFTGPSLGFTILNAAANTLLSLELQALEADSRGKIVSNPRVVTTNLRPAVILQGNQIPYQTYSTGSTAPTTSFKDALLCLLVAPQVLNNDAIILNVEVQQDAQGANTSAGPAINVRRVKTQVRVNNGETAILGGIFTQNLRNDTEKVPFLGDLPVLGNLFKSTSKKDEKTEMLIFLTPRVLDEKLGSIR
jgi:type IV pilus assembly protein PilQ